MTPRITRDVLEAYAHCKYKAHLKLAGEQGTPSDYEAMLVAARDEVRRKAIGKILGRYQEGEVACSVRLTVAALKPGRPFLLDALLEDDVCSMQFDGLKKVEGSSRLGSFHYVPVLFHEGEKIHKEQRLFLEVVALLLSRLQDRMPGHGIVWHGKACTQTRVRLGANLKKVEQVLRELQQLSQGGPPRLLLNDHCQQCEFRKRCHEQAVREDNLSLLRGMGEKEIKGLARKGILTLTQLAHTFRPRRKGKRQAHKSHHRYHSLQALALRDKRIYVFGTPELPVSAVKVYLDMEGVPDESFVYLVGMLVVHQDGTEERFSFWADNKGQEQHIFEQMLAEVSRYEDYCVYCYGGYERTFLKRMRKTARRKKPVDQVLERLVNVLSLVHAHLYFPTYSNGLKEVAGCLGYSWSEPDASGLQSLVWRARWEAARAEQWKQKLLIYNQEDCTALRKVTELVLAIGPPAQPAGASTPTTANTPSIVHVQELDSWGSNRKWGRVNFMHAEFDQINNCAYFDYQREHVYVRTSKRLKKAGGKLTKSPNRQVRASQSVQVICSRCPKCGGKDLVRRVKNPARTHRTRLKRAFDLVLTPGGIKRRVIECRSSVHRCLACGEEFVPARHQRLDRHFHGLKSWAMYHHVGHRLSLQTISTLLEDLFGFRVHGSEMHYVKSQMAYKYRATYRDLLRKILAGSLLHIDETEVKLQTGKGYIWVFTNLEEVVYMYRSTREGDFLHDLLKDFRGVLVSDFYAAYDSLACPQQKCLIHLIRDMNQELLNHPYDQELCSVTQPFGTLLRAVVATVDEYGLKRRHLHQHARKVSDYFRTLSGKVFHSEAAEGLRERLLKYRDKLFTFLEHDGVPWNNNNAENAIKRFAHYREATAGSLRQSGLNDYLVLLSVCQTCRYKGVSFLKFLLSREREIDVYCERRRRRQRRQLLETYPAGCAPLHAARGQKRESPQEQTGDDRSATESSS